MLLNEAHCGAGNQHVMGARVSQIKGSDELGISDRKTKWSWETPYKTKNGNEERLRLRTSFTTCDPVLRKWPADPGDDLMRSIALATSARNREPSRGEISRYCASYFFMSWGNSGW